MRQIQETISKIEELRKKLHRLINEEKDLTDEEVVRISQRLDEVINQYNELNDDLKKQNNK